MRITPFRAVVLLFLMILIAVPLGIWLGTWATGEVWRAETPSASPKFAVGDLVELDTRARAFVQYAPRPYQKIGEPATWTYTLGPFLETRNPNAYWRYAETKLTLVGEK